MTCKEELRKLVDTYGLKFVEMYLEEIKSDINDENMEKLNAEYNNKSK